MGDGSASSRTSMSTRRRDETLGALHADGRHRSASQGARDRLQTRLEILAAGPAITQSKTGVGHLEPMTRAYRRLRAHAWKAHDAAFRRDAFEQRFVLDPVEHQRASATHFRERDFEQFGALFECLARRMPWRAKKLRSHACRAKRRAAERCLQWASPRAQMCTLSIPAVNHLSRPDHGSAQVEPSTPDGSL